MKIDTQEKLDAMRAKGCITAEMGDELIWMVVGTKAADGLSGYRMGNDGRWAFGRYVDRPAWEACEEMEEIEGVPE